MEAKGLAPELPESGPGIAAEAGVAAETRRIEEDTAVGHPPQPAIFQKPDPAVTSQHAELSSPSVVETASPDQVPAAAPPGTPRDGMDAAATGESVNLVH